MTTHGFVGSHNPILSALWVNDENQAIRIVSMAIRDNYGNIKATAEALKLSRTTLNRWVKDHPELQRVVKKARGE